MLMITGIKLSIAQTMLLCTRNAYAFSIDFTQKVYLGCLSTEVANSGLPTFKQRAGVVEVKVWINSGNLKVGDNIMLLLVAGRFKTDVLPVFEELLSLIKNEIVTESEVQC